MTLREALAEAIAELVDATAMCEGRHQDCDSIKPIEDRIFALLLQIPDYCKVAKEGTP